jgi:hypothetical protein
MMSQGRLRLNEARSRPVAVQERARSRPMAGQGLTCSRFRDGSHAMLLERQKMLRGSAVQFWHSWRVTALQGCVRLAQLARLFRLTAPLGRKHRCSRADPRPTACSTSGGASLHAFPANLSAAQSWRRPGGGSASEPSLQCWPHLHEPSSHP